MAKNQPKNSEIEVVAPTGLAPMPQHEAWEDEAPQQALVQVNPTEQVNLQTVFEEVSSVFYSSIVPDGTRNTAIKIYNAMNNTKGSIRDLQAEGKSIVVTDIIAHTLQLADDETGELTDATRVVLVDENGDGYHAVANGVISSIQKVVGVLGPAPWNPGVKMKPRMAKTRRGFYTMVLDLIAE